MGALLAFVALDVLFGELADHGSPHFALLVRDPGPASEGELWAQLSLLLLVPLCLVPALPFLAVGALGLRSGGYDFGRLRRRLPAALAAIAVAVGLWAAWSELQVHLAPLMLQVHTELLGATPREARMVAFRTALLSGVCATAPLALAALALRVGQRSRQRSSSSRASSWARESAGSS